MTKRKRKAKILTATLPIATMNRIAAEVCPLHANHVTDGMELTTKRRLWRRKNGSWTARFTYARPNEPGSTISTLVRGIEFT